MQAEIITIGDEILIGQIVDTNSAFISKEFNKIGVEVVQISSVSDTREHILEALKEAEGRADILLLTGGLGPTKDDITKHTLAEYFDDTLVQDEGVLKHVEALFKKYIATPISDLNRQQALVLSKALVLHNEYGTAPGMWIQQNGKLVISMPGVPFEMKQLMKLQVLPRIQKQFKLPFIIHKTVMTYGLGESAISEKIEQWEDSLPAHIKLAYLPNLGRVRLRLSTKGWDKDALQQQIDDFIQKLYPLIGNIIVGLEEEDEIAVVVGKKMSELKLTLALAESCTGGKLAEHLTSVPGASSYFKGGVVSYATQSKVTMLGVHQKLIDEHSVVSAQVAEAMAVGARKILNADYALSTTGNAGPTKGDADAEIGTVYIGIATPNGVYSEKFNLGNHRVRVVQKAVNKAMEILLGEISKN
ncbi:competence/damage-inducible protein A [Spongiivirga sp. MCCC 1A20706]|uniref:competence/damage-inducible protein A n=1 Tax=Spongiivirga sp. MCCC 1A20706 TaxID=3160963 RepID=UPI003977984C